MAIIGVSAALLSIAFLTFRVRGKMWHNEPLRQVVAVTTLAELAAPLDEIEMATPDLQAPKPSNLLEKLIIGSYLYTARKIGQYPSQL